LRPRVKVAINKGGHGVAHNADRLMTPTVDDTVGSSYEPTERWVFYSIHPKPGGAPMTFRSILFQRTEDALKAEPTAPPAFFTDLRLDQIEDAITASKEEYNLKPFFYTPLNDIDAVKYRHEVFQDLENKILFQHIELFAQRMRAMREYLVQANKLYYKYQKQRWFLDAVELYFDSVNCLAHDLALVDLRSHGLLGFRDYIANYVVSDRFTSLLADTKKLQADLSAVTYCVLIKGNAMQVRKYASEIDYSANVEKTFQKFQQGAVKDYRVTFSDRPEMNHIEAKVLEFVARLYPDIFSNIGTYCEQNVDYLDNTIGVFDREIQFYIAYLDYTARFKRARLKFCYPNISNTSKEIYDYEAFDLALAGRLIPEKSPVVTNDFYLQGCERIFVVSGPNQGGKTTFSRTFGQLHFLASIGCPVPGREARLFLFDKLFTHFEREENIKTLRGKLQDDLVRIHNILGEATSNSIIIMNEIFTSTTLQDAIFLSQKVMKELIVLDLICVWVTFIDELASYSEQTVSMVSMVVPENPTLRTYKINRKPADGLSYAMSIAEKHRLTYRCLKERIKS
jgi:DNA mismatch repair protein MutS